MSNTAIKFGVGDHPAEDTFAYPLIHTRRIQDAPELQPDWNSELPAFMTSTGRTREENAARAARVPPVVAPLKGQTGLKIYIAGPMTGIKNFNFPAFFAAQYMLERHGHTVFNPAERDRRRHGGTDISLGNDTGDQAQAVRDHGFSLREALRDDTHYICMEANAIAMLPGWKASKGACAEHELAYALGHQLIYLGGFYA